MDDITVDFTVADELAIRTALARFCHRCDDGDFDGVGALFTPDCVFAFPAYGIAANGPDAITELLEKSHSRPEQRGKHLTLNTVIESQGGRITSVSDYLYLNPVSPTPTPRLTGRYIDEFVEVDGQWLIARRDVRPAG
jgi:ketosteroid isomerase-like protein